MVLVVLGVYTLARRVGASAKAAAWAVVLAAYTPALLQHTVSCNNDIAIAGLLLTLFVYLLIPSDEIESERTMLCVVCAMLGMAIKPYIAFAFPGLLLLLLLRVWCDGALWRFWWPKGMLNWSLITLAIVLGAFWYLRNALLFGNPLYPVGLSIGDTNVFGDGSGVGQRGSFSLSGVWEMIGLIVSERLWDAKRIYPDLARSAGWGWAAISIGLPCAIWGLFLSPKLRNLLLASFLALCGIFAMVSVDNTKMRFVIWVPAILASATAVAVELL